MKTTDLIRSRLLLLFDIKEEELKKTILLQVYIFLVVTTLLIVKPIISSLFLYELSSDALPLGYLLTALGAVSGSFFYNKALARVQLNKIIERTLFASFLSLIVFGVLFNAGIAKGGILYIPYIWVSIFGLLSASQFWILANLVYNIREAKRVFGFIGAGAIGGAIFGGYFTSLLTRFLEAEDLFFVAALLISLCIPILRYIWKTEVLKLNIFQISKRKGPKVERPLALIMQSRLLKLIALVIGLGVLVAKLVDYQYSDYASRLIEDPEKLASFFGFWLSTLSVVSLLIQLFLTKKVVGKLGVGKSLLWLPVGILTGSVLLVLVPQLWVVVFIKVVDGSLKQSINKAATELLSIPIPVDIKNKTKTFIDVVVDSVATGLAGITLIFFINGLNLPSSYVSLIIIALIIGWIYVILKLKVEYINTFRDLFLFGSTRKKKDKPEIPITSILNSVEKVFKEGTENQVLYMLRKTLDVKDERFFKDFEELLTHQSPKIRTLAIENLYFLGSHNLSSRIEPMIQDPDQDVTTAAFRYILKFQSDNAVALFERYFNSKDETITNAALIGLAQELRNHKVLQGKFDLSSKIEWAFKQAASLEEGEIKTNKIIAILKSIGNANLKSHYFFITEHLNDTDPEIAIAATLSAAMTFHPAFIDAIIENLSRKDLRSSSTTALFNYGEAIIDTLVNKITRREMKNEDARHIPAVLEKFNSQRSANALIRIIDKTEHEVKIAAIESLRTLKWNNSSITINDRLIIDKILDECEMYQNTLAAIHLQIVVQYKIKGQTTEQEEERDARNQLIKLLETRLDRQLHRIFKYLGIKYPPSEIDTMLEIFLGGEEEQRIQAIEFLDNILEIQLKKELIPITESTLVDSAYDEKLKRLNIKVPGEKECLINLLKRNDSKLQKAVLNLMEKTNNKIFLPVAQQYINAPNQQVQKQAISAVARLSDANS